MPTTIHILLRVLVGVLGVALILRTLSSVIRTFVLPRSVNERITGFVFLNLRRLFFLRMKFATSYEDRDKVMALYAPIGLLLLVPTWLLLVAIGYTGIYWAVGVQPVGQAFLLSGSSLLTLGFAPVSGMLQTALAFSEAALGLILVALLIAYMPTMYSAFSQREAAVSMLEVRAGAPPSAVTMISRLHRIGRFDHLNELWEQWEVWFVYVEETHTSLAALPFFRSPEPNRSWVTAAGAVLDAASLINSVVDVPHDARADLCTRAGYLALRSIGAFFRLELTPIPEPGDPESQQRISISRQEFDEACAELEAGGVPLKPDREKAWRDFAGWRITYDSPLLALAAVTMAPYAPWSSDRSLPTRRLRSRSRKPILASREVNTTRAN